MVQVVIVLREPGKTKPDYSLNFDLPEVPAIGSYISIQRPDKPRPRGEDAIVRAVWWRLSHQETSSKASDPPKIGTVDEIIVECECATSPYSSDSWRSMLEGARSRGIDVPELDVDRFAISEREALLGK